MSEKVPYNWHGARAGRPPWQPHHDCPEILTCWYCGSITCEDFLAYCNPAKGARLEVADWKYGWPHKVYLDVANPRPDELHRIGATTSSEKPAGNNVEWVKNPDRADRKRFPWVYFDSKPELRLKFYTMHLTDWPGLDEGATQAIQLATGVTFTMHDGKLRYQGVHRGLL